MLPAVGGGWAAGATNLRTWCEDLPGERTILNNMIDKTDPPVSLSSHPPLLHTLRSSPIRFLTVGILDTESHLYHGLNVT